MREITSPFMLMLLLSTVFLLSCESKKEGLKIPTPAGVELQALLDKPEGTGKFPALAIAPGQGYHMRLSLFEKLAQACVENGFVSLRFDWDFYTKGGEPSGGFTKEKQDFLGAINYLESLDSVNPEKIFICGKSIGALVAIDLSLEDKNLKGLIILTFALHSPRPPHTIWPEARRLKEVKIPVQIVSGRSDPICRPEILDSLFNSLPEKPEVVYVKGDHSLKGDTPQETEANETEAVEAVIDFMKRNI